MIGYATAAAGGRWLATAGDRWRNLGWHNRQWTAVLGVTKSYGRRRGANPGPRSQEALQAAEHKRRKGWRDAAKLGGER